VVEDSGRVRVNGAELYYEVGGEGQPLVLLHDGLLDRRVWDDQFVAFARLYRTIRYDRRGYGKSSAPDRPFSDVSDLHRLLGHLGSDTRAWILIPAIHSTHSRSSPTRPPKTTATTTRKTIRPGEMIVSRPPTKLSPILCCTLSTPLS
jgi:hypothetical protein